MWHLLLFLPALMQADGCPPGYSPCNVNKCFMAVQARRTWPRAQRHCVETGGTLATITSVSQNDCVSGGRVWNIWRTKFIGLTQGGTSPYWIGMVQIGDSGHQWVDGSEVSFSKWKEGGKVWNLLCSGVRLVKQRVEPTCFHVKIH